MERSERFGDLPTSLLKALEGWQSGVWTALPCLIVSFNAAAMTCVAQPLLQGSIRQKDGTFRNVNMPLLLDVPVIFPSGGGFTLTFPVTAGDEALVVFASRCIDAWWQLGPSTSTEGPGQPQAELRMHDLSDGFALVGPRSQPRVIPAINTTATQLRSDDGVTYVEVDNTSITLKAATVTVDCTTATVNASGSATIKSPSITLKNAGAAIRKLMNSDLVAWLTAHTHSGCGGVSNSGPPTSAPSAATQTTVVQAE